MEDMENYGYTLFRTIPASEACHGVGEQLPLLRLSLVNLVRGGQAVFLPSARWCMSATAAFSLYINR